MLSTIRHKIPDAGCQMPFGSRCYVIWHLVTGIWHLLQIVPSHSKIAVAAPCSVSFLPRTSREWPPPSTKYDCASGPIFFIVRCNKSSFANGSSSVNKQHRLANIIEMFIPKLISSFQADVMDNQEITNLQRADHPQHKTQFCRPSICHR